jgi:hypothetical protein
LLCGNAVYDAQIMTKTIAAILYFIRHSFEVVLLIGRS